MAVAALGTGALLRGPVSASGSQAAQREAASLLGAMAAQALQSGAAAQELTAELGESLAGAEGGLYRDSAVSLYARQEEGVWTLEGSNTGLAPGIRGELCPGFDRERAEQALSGGSLFWEYAQGGESRYVLYRAVENGVLALDVDAAPLAQAGRAGSEWMARGLAALAVLLTALTGAILCWITLGVRRCLKGMERLAAGERQVQVQVGGGDELASLAEDVNALSAPFRTWTRGSRSWPGPTGASCRSGCSPCWARRASWRWTNRPSSPKPGGHDALLPLPAPGV